MGGLTIAELSRRVFRRCVEDDLAGRSAQLAYYFFLAVFPFFLILTTVLGFMAQTSATFLDTILDYLGDVAPRSAHHLVLTTVHEIRTGAGAGKLSLGVIGTLWAASMGVGGIIDGLNKAHDVREERPWWRTQLLQIGLTLTLGGFAIVALTAILYGSQFAEKAAGRIGLEQTWTSIWAVLRWPLVLGLVLAALLILYKYAPNIQGEAWRRFLPGAMVAMVLWICASLGLRVYLSFQTYRTSYGSLGAVITLLLWFYLTAAALLIGGEVNSEIEDAAAGLGTREVRRPGEHVPRKPAAGPSTTAETR